MNHAANGLELNRVELRRISNKAALRKLQTCRKGRQVNARPSDLIFSYRIFLFPLQISQASENLGINATESSQLGTGGVFVPR